MEHVTSGIIKGDNGDYYYQFGALLRANLALPESHRLDCAVLERLMGEACRMAVDAEIRHERYRIPFEDE
jgi:hypothetical protein